MSVVKGYFTTNSSLGRVVQSGVKITRVSAKFEFRYKSWSRIRKIIRQNANLNKTKRNPIELALISLRTFQPFFKAKLRLYLR